MFKSVNDVSSVSDEKILEIVSEGWNANLSKILDEESLGILKQARKVETEAEKIAFAIRKRYDDILDEEKEGVDLDNIDEYDIDEFMNSIADELGMQYNGEYEHRPDYFWVPSQC